MSRIVPWMCREEWLTTFQNLYNFHDTKLQVKGVKRVQAWKSRSSGKLPLSIEATASLIAASISDVEESQKSPLTVRLAMSMAIVRFVNGMVDMEQKGVFARSVQSIADDIGLPDWLVDLRHEATHAGLPSLEVLRAGCRFSLGWLRDHYWESQVAEIQERDEKLMRLVQKFIEENERDLSKGEKKKNRKKTNLGILKEIVELTCEYDMWDAVIDLLIGKLGLLIPSLATLKEFTACWPDIIEHSTANIAMDLPRETFSLWSPLFKALHKENAMFLSKLVTMLIKKVHEYEDCSENIVIVRYISCWAYFFLLTSGDQSKEGKQWKVKVELDFGAILEVCLQSYSSYTPLFLPLIFDNMTHLPDRLKEKLKKLCAFDQGTATGVTLGIERSAAKEKAFYDRLAEHFPHLADHVKSRLNQSTEFKHAGWQSCGRSVTRSVPLGGLIGCEPMQFEQLELPEELDSMQVETSADQEISLEPRADDCEVSGEITGDDSGNEGSSGMLCDTSGISKDLTRSVIGSISQQIWIF